MKFSEMPYVRPDLEALEAKTNETVAQLECAQNAEEAVAAYRDFDRAMDEASTMGSIAYVRHTIDTRDAFYDGEQAWMDETMPRLQEMSQRVKLALLASPFREAVGEAVGPLLLTNLAISVRTFKPELMELMGEENRLTSEYQKLYASAVVEFDGQTMPLPKLGPYKQSPDRAVRRAAFEAEGGFFDAHREELDELFDKLVKNRTEQARRMGYDNFLPLAYDRRGRNCYGPEKVAALREQIVRELVPLVSRRKEEQAARLGLDHLCFHDDTTLFPDGNAVPQGTADDILKAGLDMYRSLSPETAEFVNFLYENELLDVLSKEGKAPGGYCTHFESHQAPFIFSNFNGTAGDVDVLTHEAGHAFAAYRSLRKGYVSDLRSPTLESCECHSMAMEFLTQDYHQNFFGPATRKYEIGHCEEALFFLPYGCMVDEFQHRVYEQPELTPVQRNELWAELEQKYRPWIDFDGVPFYGRGAGWQRQLHIYQYPLYYIDYCMAQVVALQFWLASMEDRADAWRRYLELVDKGGSCTFEELVHGAGLKVPYDEGCIGDISRQVSRWLDENPL